MLPRSPETPRRSPRILGTIIESKLKGIHKIEGGKLIVHGKSIHLQSQH